MYLYWVNLIPCLFFHNKWCLESLTICVCVCVWVYFLHCGDICSHSHCGDSPSFWGHKSKSPHKSLNVRVRTLRFKVEVSSGTLGRKSFTNAAYSPRCWLWPWMCNRPSITLSTQPISIQTSYFPSKRPWRWAERITRTSTINQTAQSAFFLYISWFFETSFLLLPLSILPPWSRRPPQESAAHVIIWQIIYLFLPKGIFQRAPFPSNGR